MTDEWNTPSSIYIQLDNEFRFDFDPCPNDPSFNGLQIEWGQRSYVNPPFSNWQIWVHKGYEEHKKGKMVVIVYPIDKWVLMLIEAGAKISNLGDVKWLATEDGTPGKGTGRHIAQFVLETSTG